MKNPFKHSEEYQVFVEFFKKYADQFKPNGFSDEYVITFGDYIEFKQGQKVKIDVSYSHQIVVWYGNPEADKYLNYNFTPDTLRDKISDIKIRIKLSKIGNEHAKKVMLGKIDELAKL